MDKQILYPICMILLILLITFVIICIFLNKNQNISPSNGPNNHILDGGVFYLATDNSLIYRNKNNEYYYAGVCNSCQSACNYAVPIRDVYKTVQVNNKFINILVESGDSKSNELKNLTNGKTITNYQCSSIVDPSDNPISNYINNQIVKDLNYDTTKPYLFPFKSIWDFFSDNKDEILTLIQQFGEIKVLSKLIGEYAMIYMFLPGLFNSDSRLGTVYALSLFGGKTFLFETLPFMIRALSAEYEVVAKVTGDYLIDFNIVFTTQLIDRAVQLGIQENIALMLEEIGNFLAPVFDAIGFIMIIGMFLDMVDPCGLKNTMTNDDFDKFTNAFDQAFFQTLKTQVPFEYFADYIPKYKLYCNYDKDKSPECQEQFQKRLLYTKQYQDSLKQNSLGECYRPLTIDEQNERLNTIFNTTTMRIPTVDEGNQYGFFNQIDRAIDYISFGLADNNYIVGQFFRQYWYILVLIIVVIILIVFFIN